MPILFADDFPSESTRLRRVADGTVEVVARGIWTDRVGADPEDVVAEHWRTIVAHFLPNAVITGRTGFDHFPENGRLFVSHARWRPLELPGLTVYPDGRDERRSDDIQLTPGLYGASLIRAIIDNAETRGRPSDPPRRLSPAELRARLQHLLPGLADGAREHLLADLAGDENAVAAEAVRTIIDSAQHVALFELP